jgi:hypothetical protein
MDVREVNDLMDHWIDNPPVHVAVRQLRDVVISAFGGRPPSRSSRGGGQSPEQLLGALGVNLEASDG